MEISKQEDNFSQNISNLLELSAMDDLVGFKHAIEQEGQNADESGLWYGRRIGSNKMGFEERTPLMVAALLGSKHVLNYILETGSVDPNRACGSDGATALHCAAASGACHSYEIVKLLIDASADIHSLNTNGKLPRDIMNPKWPKSFPRWIPNALKAILNGEYPTVEAFVADEARANNKHQQPEKKEYPVDPSLPDMNDGIYSTDEFRMYMFKVRPCSRAYSHDWTECPFLHPGENARRRDPSKYHYSCVPCPDFRKGACAKADGCEFAHGIFESWLHPAQYRTRMCKDEPVCARKICFFAHGPDELRSTNLLYASSAGTTPVASPRSMSSIGSPLLSPSKWAMWQNQPNVVAPPALHLTGSRLNTTFNARDIRLEAELRDLESQKRRQQLLEELATLSSPSGSPTRTRVHHNMNPQLHYSSYSSALLSSPLRSSVVADMSSPKSMPSGFSSPARSSPTMMPSRLSDWGSPSAEKWDWGILGDEVNQLRKSVVSPDISWVHSIIKDTSTVDAAEVGYDEDQLTQQHKQSCVDGEGSEVIPSCLEQLYMEQQRMTVKVSDTTTKKLGGEICSN